MTATKPTPEEVVEEARALLNRHLEKLQRNNGINERYDLSIDDAVALIRALDKPYSRGPHFDPARQLMTSHDRELAAQARWYPASKLSVYLDSQSDEFQRDLNAYGVYTLVELTARGEIPRFVEATPRAEATPRYVGMSGVLSSRLKHHARGDFGSNPADHVTSEYLLEFCTEEERAAYAVASRSEQRQFRGVCMDRRDLWVRATHTTDKAAAAALEQAMIHKYEEQGFDLWNTLKYPIDIAVG